MQTKRKPQHSPNTDQSTPKKATPDIKLPRGIRFAYRPDRPNAPFYLYWRKDGKETARGFVDEKTRELAALDLINLRKDFGREIFSFDPAEWRIYQTAMQRIRDAGHEVNLLIVAEEWLKSKQGKAVAAGKTVRVAVEDYEKLREEEGSWGEGAKRHAKTHLSRFAQAFGSLRLNAVGVEEVRRWMRNLAEVKDADGRQVHGPHSIGDHLKNVRTFFNYALRERWGAVENPCAFIKPPKVEDCDPVVIPLRDAFAFFKANKDERVTARVALEAFGAVRYTTAGLIAKDALIFDDKGIRMAAEIHKSGRVDGRARYRQGHPDNLWEWLRHAPEATWRMTALNYREEKRYAWIRAGLRPSANNGETDEKKIASLRNIWRHSFISYHLAAFRNVPLTQYLAQHANPQMTEDYEGIAGHEDALRYFMITPKTVALTWKKFMALPVREVSKPKT